MGREFTPAGSYDGDSAPYRAAIASATRSAASPAPYGITRPAATPGALRSRDVGQPCRRVLGRHQGVRAALDGLGPLGLAAKGHARGAQPVGLALQPAGVGHHDGRVAHGGDGVEIAERLAHRDAARHGGAEPVPLEREARARMHRKDHRQAERAQRSENLAELLRVAGERCAVDGRQGERRPAAGRRGHAKRADEDVACHIARGDHRAGRVAPRADGQHTAGSARRAGRRSRRPGGGWPPPAGPARSTAARPRRGPPAVLPSTPRARSPGCCWCRR